MLPVPWVIDGNLFMNSGLSSKRNAPTRNDIPEPRLETLLNVVLPRKRICWVGMSVREGGLTLCTRPATMMKSAGREEAHPGIFPKEIWCMALVSERVAVIFPNGRGSGGLIAPRSEPR